MPTYDYECQACHHVFERWQGVHDKKLKACPKCKKLKLVRLVGAGGGLIFKGSGFYVTDYKRKGGGGDAGKSGDAAPPTPSASSTPSSSSPSAEKPSGGATKPSRKGKSE